MCVPEFLYVHPTCAGAQEARREFGSSGTGLVDGRELGCQRPNPSVLRVQPGLSPAKHSLQPLCHGLRAHFTSLNKREITRCYDLQRTGLLHRTMACRHSPSSVLFQCWFLRLGFRSWLVAVLKLYVGEMMGTLRFS